jgi:hypothetical protein
LTRHPAHPAPQRQDRPAATKMSESDGSTTRNSFSTGTSGGGSSAASDTSDAAALNALQDRG